MVKYDILSIIAVVLTALGFWFGGIIWTLVLIVGAIVMSVSYKKIKDKKEYAMWPLYIAMIFVVLAILLRIFGMSIVSLL